MNYDDIIDLPHHVSKHHKPMPMLNRAAQFAPFAALTGYDDAVENTVEWHEKTIAEREEIRKDPMKID